MSGKRTSFQGYVSRRSAGKKKEDGLKIYRMDGTEDWWGCTNYWRQTRIA